MRRPGPSQSGAESFLHAGTKEWYSPVFFLLYLFPFSSTIICSLILTVPCSPPSTLLLEALCTSLAAAAGQARVLVFQQSGFCYVVIHVMVSSRFPHH